MLRKSWNSPVYDLLPFQRGIKEEGKEMMGLKNGSRRARTNIPSAIHITSMSFLWNAPGPLEEPPEFVC